MCGSLRAANTVPDNWLGGFYQVYPVWEELPELSEKFGDAGLGDAGLETLRQMFPDRLEAYCVLALFAAAGENDEWAGATYHYLDRLAVGGLRREHGKFIRRCLARFVRSFGTFQEMSRTDVFVFFTESFLESFWASMAGMVRKGYVRTEEREIADQFVKVFFPTARLINKINCSLTS